MEILLMVIVAVLLVNLIIISLAFVSVVKDVERLNQELLNKK